MGTGILYAAIVVAWAAYLLPLVKHHREQTAANRTRRFTGAMRVLGKRSSSSHGRVGAAQAMEPGVAEDLADAEDAAEVDDSRPGVNAAARRRRVLSLILATAVVLGVFAFVGTVPWWSMAIPGGLLVGFVVVARLSLRAAARKRAMSDSESGDGSQPADTSEVGRSKGARQPRSAAAAAVLAARAAAAAEPDVVNDPIAAWVAHSPVDAWDPLPVTLPTYVTKDAAPARRVRTIDLSGPAAFSAGRLPEAELLSRQPKSVDEIVAAEGVDDGHRHAATG